MRAPLLLSTLLAATLAGCGAAPSGTVESHTRPGAGAIHAVAQSANGQARTLSVDYAAAGLSAASLTNPEDSGSLVIVGVFRDGRVDDSLDLETLSINVPLSSLPGSTGALDTIVNAADLTVLLEGSAGNETRLIAPDAVKGTLHLRYDAPPRPGITLRGDFSLVVEPAPGRATLKLEGEFEVPVLGG